MKKLSLLILCILTSSFQLVEDLAKVPVLTHSLSERKVAKVRLKNGLEAYLISDPHVSQSGAALSVEVGSWHDPEEYPGMAHFVEHMLFMGSEAYPGENEHSAFLRDHGGNENAFTAPDRTLYVFSIDHQALPEALDRFSHFFIDPLFSPNSIDRERIAVDEEFAMIKDREEWRRWMIMKETGNPNHPNAGFGIGNKQTLMGVPQEALQTWHKSHYSADLMHLAVISPLPIEQLIDTVDRLFSPVPSRESRLPIFAQEILSQKQKEQMLYVDSMYQDNKLELIWEIPQEFINEKTKSVIDLAAIALAHPMKNSLQEVLKRKGLGYHVNVSLDPVSKSNMLLIVEVSLFEKGLRNIDETIDYCFQALARQKENGIPAFLSDELRHLSTLSYQYQSRNDVFDTVLFHADHLITEKLDTYPEKTFLYEDYEPEFYQKFIQTFLPETCLYMVSTNFKDHKINTYQTEKWTGSKYSLQPINPYAMSRWQKAFPHPGIEYPKPNPYLPKPQLNTTTAEIGIFTLEKSSDAHIYFQQDHVFLTPETCALFTLYSPLLNKTAKSEALLSLLIFALNKELKNSTYFASKAGLDYIFYHELGKLNIQVQGYNDQVPLFLEQVFNKLCSLEPTEDQFLGTKAWFIDYLANSKDPIEQTEFEFHTELFPEEPTNSDQIKALKNVSFMEFNAFLQGIWKNHFIEGFLYGNLKQEEAENLWHLIKGNLPENPVTFDRISNASPQIPEKEATTLIEVRAEESGHATLLGLYQGKTSFENRGAQRILGLALKEAFFDTLRTKQQTGYIVHSWIEEIDEELFQFFQVLSSQYAPDDLLKRFEIFLEDFLDHLSEKISPNRFETLRNTLVAALGSPAKNVKEKTQELHYLVTKRKGDFNWFDKNIVALKALTYEQFLIFARQSLSTEQPRMAILVRD